MVEQRFEEIVRLMDTDLDGNESLEMSLKRIKGIDFRLSRAILVVSGLEPKKKLKEISEDQIRKLEGIIKNPVQSGVPSWMINRRKDINTGEDMHLVSNDLDFARKSDIDMMKKIRTWKGLRHTLGQPVRGQSTRSSFRVSGMVIGVSRKAVKAAAAPAAAEAAGPAAGAAPATAKPGVVAAKPSAATAKPAAAPGKPAAPVKPEAKKK
ncbi:MAG: 30S ribosomal protein S13 [Candidatus Aenigmarchaeota archaeon]|nr:30S ribosomal protein S13 [Candidatus Aenigmarchaeota archaeon]